MIRRVPILYEVDRLRDGRSFTTRRVVAIQHGEAIFNLQASFHGDEAGPDHQLTMPEGMPDPESLPDWNERLGPTGSSSASCSTGRDRSTCATSVPTR